MLVTFIDDLSDASGIGEGMRIQLGTDKGITFEYCEECGYYGGEYFISVSTLLSYLGMFQ